MLLQQRLFLTALLPEANNMEKEIIAYDDFAKLDIAIGLILSVEEIEGADKLLKLSVDVGEEKPRQILSGIKEFYPDIQVLVGKRCPFLVNLAPRTIRGLESQGMILASDNEEMLALLNPDQPLPPGTRVH
jgi:methionine--tRNA ligase beta chain